MKPGAESNRGLVSDARRSRLTFMFIVGLVVIFTLLFVRDPSRGWQGASVLVVLYVVLGYVAYFAAVRGYALDVEDPRPHLSVGKGIPAWGFFLVGGVLLFLVAVAWGIWGSPRNALLFGGITLAYVSIAYPEKLSIRRAAYQLQRRRDSGGRSSYSGVGLRPFTPSFCMHGILPPVPANSCAFRGGTCHCRVHTKLGEGFPVSAG